MRTPRDSGLRRRRAVPSILMLAVAVAFAASGSASGQSGDASSRFQAASLTPDSTFTGSKSQTGYLARTDPALLGKTGTNPVNVVIKYDYDAAGLLRRRHGRPQATSPIGPGRLRNRTAAVRAYEATRRSSGKITAGQGAAVAPRCAPSRPSTAASRRRVPANTVADLLKVDGVVAVQNDDLEQPRPTRRPSSSARPRSGRRSAARPGRRGRHRRRHRHRHLAGASVVPRTAASGAARRPVRLPVRRRQRRRDLGAGLHVQRQADRRVRVHRTRTWPSSARSPRRVLQQRRPRLLGARR